MAARASFIADPAHDAAKWSRNRASRNSKTAPRRCDLLLALGRPLHRLTAEQVSGTRPAWEAAAAWIAIGPVREIIVLHTHLLSGTGIAQLLQVREPGKGRSRWSQFSSK